MGDHSSGAVVTNGLKRHSLGGSMLFLIYFMRKRAEPPRARPCTQVRILPFHPSGRPEGSSPGCFQSGDGPCLSSGPSLLASLAFRRTGVTRYPAPAFAGRVRTFLPSSKRGAITLCGPIIQSIFPFSSPCSNLWEYTLHSAV